MTEELDDAFANEVPVVEVSRSPPFGFLLVFMILLFINGHNKTACRAAGLEPNGRPSTILVHIRHNSTMETALCRNMNADRRISRR